MKLNNLLLLLLLFLGSVLHAEIIKGKICDVKTLEALYGVSIFDTLSSQGTISDLNGNFELEIKEFPTSIRVSYLGYKTQIITLTNASQFYLIKLVESETLLEEVAIRSEKAMYAKSSSLSLISLQGKAWQSLPAFGGESDIVSVFMTMPGIKKGGDGSGGMLVRGGGADQNMVLLNGTPVYQSGHIISFYSPFQSELIQSASLYKGNAPAQYGGRISSVLAIENSLPDSQFKAEIGLGLLLGKISLSGSLNSKTRYVFAARRSAQDLVWPLFGQNFPAQFSDVQAGIFHQINARNNLELRYFRTSDKLSVGGSDIAKYKESEQSLLPDMKLKSQGQEEHLSLRYKYQSRDKKTSYSQSLYAVRNSMLNALLWTDNQLEIESKLLDFGLNGLWQKQLSKNLGINAGYQASFRHFEAMKLKSQGEISQALASREAERNAQIDHALFIASDYKITTRTLLESGLRLSQFKYLEPRLNLNHSLNSKINLSIGLERNTQILQKVSSSSTALPIDVWYPSKDNLKAQSAWQTQLGARYASGAWVIESEFYYKKMQNLSEYAEGSLPLQCKNLASEMVQGSGKAYGGDFQMRYEAKSFSLWANYSLSWSKRKFEDLNGGMEFFDRWDRRHDFNIGIRKKITPQLTASAIFYYSSGVRYTPRIAQYIAPGVPDPSPVLLPVFGARNSSLLSAPHRLDLSLSYTKPIKRGELEMQVGVYNLYNSLQSFRVEVLERQGKYVFREVGLFGMMPSLSIKWKF